jgi:hypothetical protein
MANRRGPFRWARAQRRRAGKLRSHGSAAQRAAGSADHALPLQVGAAAAAALSLSMVFRGGQGCV